MGDDAKDNAFPGGEVLFAGGTDWGMIGRSIGGGKKGKEVLKVWQAKSAAFAESIFANWP